MPIRTFVFAATLTLLATPVYAEEATLAFKAAGGGLYEFDTGVFRGQLKLDGRYQGLYPFIDTASGAELVHPPGVFSFYRVFSTGTRYGNAARDWPTVTKVLPDGAVEVHWPAAQEHPLEITAVYRWSAADTLDLEITVVARQAMPDFELFMSSYFGKGFRASVLLKPEDDPGSGPRFVPVDRKPDSKGGYVMFPQHPKALAMILDGRWKIPPSAVDWDTQRWLAAPLVFRRDSAEGITAVMMARGEDCFAVSSPWNPATPESGGYRSLYLSLFGRDIEADRPSRARCRLVIGHDITDRRAQELYEAYLDETK